MALPLSFLSGLLLLLLHAELDDTLPGAESAGRFFASCGMLIVPWLLARVVAALFERSARGVGPSLRVLNLGLRAQTVVVPLCYGVMLFEGQLPLFVARYAPESQVVHFALLFAPLLLMEASMRWAERRTAASIEKMRVPSAPMLGPSRLPMTLFVVAPFMALAAVADVLGLDRRAEVFFNETSLGTILGLLLLVVGLCVALPLIFRVVMPVSRQLPPNVAGDLRRTAASLDFPGSGLLSMRTGLRIVNAALVGPVPWPRYLVLTDGLLALLDPLALRGVVAHEVGHAKANHPGLLVLVFAVVPLLLFFPMTLLAAEDLGAPWTFVGLGVGAVVAWFALRLLAHRFEFEADQLSSEALGGASYCVQALRRVGGLAPRTQNRSSFRHPSESRRIQHLFACEHDSAYQARFWRRGRWLRRSIAATLVVAVALCVWAQLTLWPVDRAAYLFYNGRFEEARAQLAALPSDLSEPQEQFVERLGLDIETGLELGLTSSTWDAVRDDLAPRAYARAEDLLAMGAAPDRAVPWLSLALYQRQPEAWLQCLYLYCRAVERQEDERAAEIVRHLRTLELPERVRQALQ